MLHIFIMRHGLFVVRGAEVTKTSNTYSMVNVKRLFSIFSFIIDLLTFIRSAFKTREGDSEPKAD